VDDDERRREVGRRISVARKAKGLSQAALAHAFGEGFQSMNVTRWESGKHMPQGTHLPTLARVLGRSADWLLAIEPQVDPSTVPVATLADEVLALCDAVGVARPTPEETAWLLAEPQFHRRTPMAVIDVLRTHRSGMTPEMAEASEKATEKHRDPAVPRRSKR
jgi:transcriptional regulator with XRE-family HTH domain